MNDSNFSDIRVLTILLQQLFKYKYIFISLFAALLLLIFYFYIESKTSEGFISFASKESTISHAEFFHNSFIINYS